MKKLFLAVLAVAAAMCIGSPAFAASAGDKVSAGVYAESHIAYVVPTPSPSLDGATVGRAAENVMIAKKHKAKKPKLDAAVFSGGQLAAYGLPPAYHPLK
jgi:hypothetical protein